MGTPAFAVPALRAVAERCEVVRVVTRPDRPKGRGRSLAESDVSVVARELRLDVAKPSDMKSAEVLAELKSLAPDLLAVVAFGAILTPAVLAVPKHGSVNLHGSLLPDYRGASPVQGALWDGRATTGVSTLFMDEGIDSGDVILTRSEAVRPEDDAGSLAARLAEIGGPLLADSLLMAAEGRAPRTRQDPAAGSYAKKLKKSDGVVEWSLDAITLWHRQRAVTPWPGAVTTAQGRQLTLMRLRPLEAEASGSPGRVIALGPDSVTVACGRGAVMLERVKPEGRPEMTAAEWARGARLAIGDRIGGMREVEA